MTNSVVRLTRITEQQILLVLECIFRQFRQGFRRESAKKITEISCSLFKLLKIKWEQRLTQ